MPSIISVMFREFSTQTAEANMLGKVTVTGTHPKRWRPSKHRDYPKGSPPPSGYVSRSMWAESQLAHGMKQEQCGQCSLWNFPQELSGTILESKAVDSKGNEVILRSPLCKACKAKQ